ncbi:hypothetical protein KAI58_01495 [Candidatus Gracilibacteria bacterium]|nr:hypothetical protein [Candidatus Gracilibacteria bacterium]
MDSPKKTPVHLIGARASNEKELGHLAKEFSDHLEGDSNIDLTLDIKQEAPEESCVVYARKVLETLPKSNELNGPLIIASTGVNDVEYEDAETPVVLAPNLSIEVVEALVRKLPEMKENHPNADFLIIEAHQKAKESIPGTAKEGAKILMEDSKVENVVIKSMEEWEEFAKNPLIHLGKIVSVRCDEISEKIFKVPDEAIGGHGIHKFIAYEDEGKVDEVETQVLGRKAYAEGLGQLIQLLENSPDEFKKGVTSIFELVQKNLLKVEKA